MEEIEREFIALKNMRQEEAARSQQWRHTLLNSSVPVEPIDNSQNNSELEAKVRQLESELENMKEKSFQNVQTELPGMNSDHMANYQAEVDYTKFAQFETAISDQMDVIEKLTEEKRGISVSVHYISLYPHHI